MTYYIKNPNKNLLLNRGFRYSPSLSGEDETILTYKFPAYRYNAAISLEGEFVVCIETGKVTINCYDFGTRSKYASFYYDFGNQHEPLLENVWKGIHREMEKFNIEERKDED